MAAIKKLPFLPIIIDYGHISGFVSKKALAVCYLKLYNDIIWMILIQRAADKNDMKM